MRKHGKTGVSNQTIQAKSRPIVYFGDTPNACKWLNSHYVIAGTLRA